MVICFVKLEFNFNYTMENATILLYDICRLCLDEPGVDNIFKPVDLSHDILSYTGVKVKSTDKLPQTICNSCRDIITCVKVLKDVATVNDARLQSICGTIGDSDTQVLHTDSPSHLVIISSCTNDSKQNDTTTSEISSSSENVSFKDRITFEGDSSKQEKSKEKKKFSSKHDQSAPKLISVRKDLFDSSATVTSSTKTSELPPTSASSHNKDVEKKVNVTSTTKRERSSLSPDKSPQKIVKVDGKDLKVFKYEYKCETCNKTYATHKKLYLHQLAHNKKFNCPLDACGKTFATKGDLQKHIRSHTGEKPFKCSLCEQSFSQNVSLKAHKQSKHNETKSQS